VEVANAYSAVEVAVGSALKETACGAKVQANNGNQTCIFAVTNYTENLGHLSKSAD
jgi:hypothetical protein